MTPAAVAIDVFGGIRATARVLDVEASTVLRWARKEGGHIPDRHKDTLLEASRALGLHLSLAQLTWGQPGVRRRVVTFGTARSRVSP